MERAGTSKLTLAVLIFVLLLSALLMDVMDSYSSNAGITVPGIIDIV